MMTFIAGVSGLFIGTGLGMLIAALCVMARDERE